MSTPLHTDRRHFRPEAVMLLTLLTMALALPGTLRLPGMFLAGLPAGASLALLAWTCHLSRLGALRSFSVLGAAAFWTATPHGAGLEVTGPGGQITAAASFAACAFAAAGLAVATRSPRSWH